MEKSLPKLMKAIIVYRQDQPFKVEQVPVPIPQKGQILIKVEAAPINPSDILFSQGLYPAGKQYPVVGGFEGSGTVVDAGDEISKAQIGKRVAFLTSGNNGTWSEYTIANTNSIFELDPEVDFKIGASSFVNPLTAIAMLNITIKEGHKAVVHNAGSSALGKMMTRLFHKNNIPVISVVRKQEQIGQLKEELGQDVLVFNSTSETFLKDLKKVVSEQQATGFFDAVGGKQTGQILQVMPPKSICYHYGLLSGRNMTNLDSTHFIFNHQQIKGFWLIKYLSDLPTPEKIQFFKKLRQDFKESLTSKIYKTYQYEDIYNIIKDYEQNSSKGKIILVPKL